MLTDSLTDDEPDDPGTEQQHHHRAGKLPPQQPCPADPTVGSELVAAVRPATTHHFVVGEPAFGIDVQPRENLIDRLCVGSAGELEVSRPP